MDNIKKPLSLTAEGAGKRFDGCLKNTAFLPFCQVANIFFRSGEVCEIRALGLYGKGPWDGWAKGTVSGYFNDPAKLEAAVKTLDKLDRATGIYFCMNPVNPALLARANNRLIVPQNTTTDEQVLCQRWLLGDTDPKRPSGISATDAELEKAITCRDEIAAFLHEHSFPDPIRAYSGNGGHLLYKLPDLPNTPEIAELKRQSLQALKHKFDSNFVHVDPAVSNASRITKLYGTLARKGDSMSDRPHRRSYLDVIPEPIVPVTLEQLQWLASLAPEDKPTNSYAQKIQTGDNSAGKEKCARKVLESCCEKIRQSPPGDQHHIRRDMARLIGGYLQYIGGAEVFSELEQAVIASGAQDLRASMKTIKDGLEYGKMAPITIPDIEPGQSHTVHQDKSLEAAQKTIEHLASLALFMYEQQQMSMAEKLGVRVSILDQEVEKIRRANSPDKAKSLVEDLEPWPESITGAELLDAIYKIALDYVIMPEKSAVAFSLWTLLTYSYNAFRILPVLELKSPEKRCGKTRLLEVLSGLAYRAFPSCNLTPATIYRVIEKYRPCFLIDEADTFLPQNDELRGVLNSGHTVKSAFVTRINPDTMEPECFSTWGPKAIVLIGKLPGTLDDRAICISLKRKLPIEKVKRLGLDFDDKCLHLRRKCMRWATDNMDRLKVADPQLPDIDNDRALDNWTPLIAIADLVGGSWPKSARDAMVEIEAGREDDSARVMLIQDIQSVFNDRACERLWTQNLIEALVAMEDRPWAEWKKGKPLSGASLSRLLKPFGIKPGEIRQGDDNKRGYKLKQFDDVFKRYIPQTPISKQSATVLQSANHASSEGNQNATDSESVALQNSLKPAPIAKCSTVALQNEGIEEEDIKVLEDDQGREVLEI